MSDDSLDAVFAGFTPRQDAAERNRLVEEMLRLEASRLAWGLTSEAPTAAAPLTHCPVCKQRLRKPRPEFHGLKIVDGKRKD